MSTALAPLAALADPTRARIARILLAAPGRRASVTALADELGLRQPTVSHHLSTLREAGVVTSAKEGRRVWYALAPERLDRVAEIIGAEPSAPLPFDADGAVDRIAERFRGIHSRETVAACLAESMRLLAAGGEAPRDLGSRAADFTASRLEALARAAGQGPRETPEVLFVCVRNAGRSQLAAALLRQLAGPRVNVRSAGSAPAARLAPDVVASLDEVGVPLGGEFPKPLTDEAVRAADVVVTMGCGDACPVYPGKRYEDWDLPDPAILPLDEVRAVRDEIERRVRRLLDELLPR
jgi:ArsR family transcriptional regulator